MQKIDYDEIVTLVTFAGRQPGLTLAEAVRLVVEDFPEKTPKQLSAFIEREGRPPIGPLSEIRKLYQNSAYPLTKTAG